MILILLHLLSLLGLAAASPVLSTDSKSLEKRDIYLQPFSKRSLPRARRHFELEESPRLLRRSDNVNNLPHHLYKRADTDAITQFNDSNPLAPIRGPLGGPFYHPSNTDIDKQNIDYISPPNTDAGVIPNLKWSFPHSHTRLLAGGWVREQTITDLPSSKDFAAAELTLTPGSYREIHWHRVVEWAIVLSGHGRISAIDDQGRTSIDDVQTGDLWYFPPGAPHSIQAIDDHLEFLVLFGDGNFDAQGTTFMFDDWIAHTPKDVVAQNLGVNISLLSSIPQKDPYIVKNTTVSPATAAEAKNPSSAGDVPNSFIYKLSQEPANQKKGGWVKIADSTNFNSSREVAAALVSVEPQGLRELHWHAKAEWFYVISGTGRVTAFAGSGAARTFEVGVGDSGVFPASYGHYVQNIGDDNLTFIEIFPSKRFADFSLTQWLALAPTEVVATTLNISFDAVKQLSAQKQTIVA